MMVHSIALNSAAYHVKLCAYENVNVFCFVHAVAGHGDGAAKDVDGPAASSPSLQRSAADRLAGTHCVWRSCICHNDGTQ